MSQPGDVIWAGGRAWQKWDNTLWCHLWAEANDPTMATSEELQTLPDFCWLVKEGEISNDNFYKVETTSNADADTIIIIDGIIVSDDVEQEKKQYEATPTEPQGLGAVIKIGSEHWTRVSTTATLPWCRLYREDEYDSLNMFKEYYYPAQPDTSYKDLPALTNWNTLSKTGDITILSEGV